MQASLAVSIGQFSDRGRKETNQDFHGALVPDEPALTLKGIVVAIADGISSSSVSHIAAETAVKSLLSDYYCTSETWTVKTAATRVIAAANSWLYAHTRQSAAHDRDRGYVCTLSALVLKGARAHIFHAGDCRIYRLSGRSLEQLTEDHRVSISSVETYLGRALGAEANVEIDYRAVPLSQGDVFVLASDGVYDHVSPALVAEALNNASSNLDEIARMIAEEALRHGSADNLTLQIVRVDNVPAGGADDILGQSVELPPAPLLEPGTTFDGYAILRRLHASSRSHLYLAEDSHSGALAVLKIPSIDLRDDDIYLRRLMMEEWIARRISSAHVLKAYRADRRRSHLYLTSEYVDGCTLRQWMIDNPRPDIEAVRGIVEQVAAGLRAFHRLEMLHQDLRPENIMIDRTGTVKIIDFGSAKVAGVAEAGPRTEDEDILGTLQYTAPEYFVGEVGTAASDLFSLGVIAYEMLTGHLPYGRAVASARTRKAQMRLRYVPALRHVDSLPAWIDGALQRAVHPDPGRRYEVLSEFLFDLRNPNPAFTHQRPPSLLEKNPLLFWQGLSLALALIAVVLAFLLVRN